MKAITDKIIKSDFVNWRNLEIIQPKGFKELSKPAYQKLRNSIIENNFVESFKVWDNGKTYLLDGVHRCKVLDILDGEGYDIPDKFRADFIECKDKKQAKKMILVYSSRYAKLLEEGLYEFVQDLDWDEITKVVDFADIDIDRFTDGYMRDTEGLTDEDEIPEVTEAITKTGDLWLLGDHRVLAGDATKKEDVERLMDGQKADMIFTDPPYSSGGFQEAGKASGSIGTRSQKRIANDNLSTRGYKNLINSVLSINRTDTLFMFCDWRMWVENFDLCENNGFRIRNMIVWNKNRMGMGRPFRSQHELIVFGSSENVKYIKSAEANVLTVERCRNELHETQKPIDLFIKILDNMEKEISKIVYDPFLGSGSTLIACEKTNRKCYGLEIDEHYCDVIVKRWEDFTGNKAILDG